jgi:hypothetical protein
MKIAIARDITVEEFIIRPVFSLILNAHLSFKSIDMVMYAYQFQKQKILVGDIDLINWS